MTYLCGIMRKVFLILHGLPATLIGCAEEPKPLRVADHSSPEAVFTTYGRVLEKRDWKTMFELLSPGERDRRILGLVAFGPGIDKHEKVTKIVERYFDDKKYDKLTKSLNVEKLTQEKREQLCLSCITDKKRLFVEANLRLDQLGTERPTWSALRKVVSQRRKAKGLATLTYFSTGQKEKLVARV